MKGDDAADLSLLSNRTKAKSHLIMLRPIIFGNPCSLCTSFLNLGEYFACHKEILCLRDTGISLSMVYSPRLLPSSCLSGTAQHHYSHQALHKSLWLKHTFSPTDASWQQW